MAPRHTVFAITIALISIEIGCQRGPDSPVEVANKFLRAVKRDEAKAWSYYSQPSQEKIRAECARLVETTPYYVEAFKPEKLYSYRFDTMIPGSVRLPKIQGSNATLVVTRRQPAGFALPGFSPLGSKKVPAEIFLVQENGAWKIDVVTPTTDERKVLAARQKAIQSELDVIHAHRMTNSAQRGRPAHP